VGPNAYRRVFSHYHLLGDASLLDAISVFRAEVRAEYCDNRYQVTAGFLVYVAVYCVAGTNESAAAAYSKRNLQQTS
jgi:hypothetical protein